MTKQQEMVKDFHRKFELEINDTPTYFAPQHPVRQLRVKLNDEETKELQESKDIYEVADALGDLMYVTLGAGVSYGVSMLNPKLILDITEGPKQTILDLSPHINLSFEFLKAKNIEHACISDPSELVNKPQDIYYSIFNFCCIYNLNIFPVFNEIHRSNMTKVWPDGKVYKNEYGKVIKPATYSPANIKAIVDAQFV
jgi:predicted HAD superfamily Cof-like phosphohydrolase